MLVLLFPEDLSQRRNVNRKVVFLNELVFPNHVEQLVFREDFTAVLDQREKQIERFGLQRNCFTVAKKQPAVRIKLEFAKAKHIFTRLAHRVSKD